MSIGRRLKYSRVGIHQPYTMMMYQVAYVQRRLQAFSSSSRRPGTPPVLVYRSLTSQSGSPPTSNALNLPGESWTPRVMTRKHASIRRRSAHCSAGYPRRRRWQPPGGAVGNIKRRRHLTDETGIIERQVEQINNDDDTLWKLWRERR